MVGSPSKFPRPPFLSIRTWCIDHKLFFRLVVRRRSLKILNIRTMTDLRLTIAPIDVTVFDERYPLLPLLLITTILNRSPEHLPTIGEWNNTFMVPKPLRLQTDPWFRKQFLPHPRHFGPKIMDLLEPKSLLLGLRHLIIRWLGTKLLMFLEHPVRHLNDASEFFTEQSIGQIFPIKVALRPLLDQVRGCHSIPPRTGHVFLGRVECGGLVGLAG